RRSDFLRRRFGDAFEVKPYCESSKAPQGWRERHERSPRNETEVQRGALSRNHPLERRALFHTISIRCEPGAHLEVVRRRQTAQNESRGNQEMSYADLCQSPSRRAKGTGEVAPAARGKGPGEPGPRGTGILRRGHPQRDDQPGNPAGAGAARTPEED